MIFVTIGTQEPFQRLIHYMESISDGFPDQKIVVQSTAKTVKIKNAELVDFLSPSEFEHKVQEARLVVSHAGMGSIITALTYNKPIVVVPRMASLGEHRNEHQLATVNKLRNFGGIRVANNQDELKSSILEVLHDAEDTERHIIRPFASDHLIISIRNFILDIEKAKSKDLYEPSKTYF